MPVISHTQPGPQISILTNTLQNVQQSFGDGLIETFEGSGEFVNINEFFDPNSQSSQEFWGDFKPELAENRVRINAIAYALARARKSSGRLNLDDIRRAYESLKITGLQIEIGQYTNETMPPFQFESFEESLFRCQRYYIQNDTKMPPTALSAATAWTHMMDFNPRMRAAPSATHVATGGFSTVGGSADTTGVATSNLGANGGRIALNLDATLTVNQWCQCALAANLDAEL